VGARRHSRWRSEERLANWLILGGAILVLGYRSVVPLSSRCLSSRDVIPLLSPVRHHWEGDRDAPVFGMEAVVFFANKRT
jgi:hypothetical protein